MAFSQLCITDFRNAPHKRYNNTICIWLLAIKIIDFKFKIGLQSLMSANLDYLVCAPFLLGGGLQPPTKFSKREGGSELEPPTKFSKREVGLTRPQLWKGIAGKEGVTFFRGEGSVAIFTRKKTKTN